MARGGSRNGKIGAAYANRTDLQTGSKPLPVTTAPGQPYGAAKAQADAQAAVPMSGTPLPPAPAVLNGQQPEPAGPMPGELAPFTGPSTRPTEPVTHGLAVGAGSGPEVLPQMGVAVQFTNTRDLINSLAQSTNSPALNTLAAYARNGL